MVALEGGRFATSDLNDLYRRVINRNNRLKKLIDLRAPQVIIRNEKRMLQEAVDALFDNGRRGRVIKGTNSRPLKSLSDTIKGKQGRFRQNLLGKRVDYSGRSVIVVGPELHLHECGLPKKMALELFKPFIFSELEARGLATNIKVAREMLDLAKEDSPVWDILAQVIQDHPVMLNRAPTLHRLGIQAFQPRLVDGNAIQLHPLVCVAFNADFDGDQMAVHVPLSPAAILEAQYLMLSARNLRSPANGKPVTVPQQDVVLGVYYLTFSKPGRRGEGKQFMTIDEVLRAFNRELLEIQTPIELWYEGQLVDIDNAKNPNNIIDMETKSHRGWLKTTVGRVIFNDAIPVPEDRDSTFYNGLLRKSGLLSMIDRYLREFDSISTVHLLDAIKAVGFEYATLSGISFGMDDMVIPEKKYTLVDDAADQVMVVEQQYKDGEITASDRYNKVIEIWNKCTDDVADAMKANLEKVNAKSYHLNPIFVMADSGARGSDKQLSQLAGMRGLMMKPSGEVIESPITANFKEGLTVMQYFSSTHGARKGLADTALKTSDSGYLTRRLVDVAQDVIIRETDCGTLNGIWSESIIERGQVVESLADRIVGRVGLEDVYDPYDDDKLIVEADDLITEELADDVQNAGVVKVKIRSVLTCESSHGVCQKCYGIDLSTGQMVDKGVAVGVIAAQSIGEPGTQLTMRTFHVGGAASSSDVDRAHATKRGGKVKFEGIQRAVNSKGEQIVTKRSGSINILDEDGNIRESNTVVRGAHLLVKEGDVVEPETVLAEWDPYNDMIVSEIDGEISFKDLVKDLTMIEETDPETGFSVNKVMYADDDHNPQLIIKEGKEQKSYDMPANAILLSSNHDEIKAGDFLAKIPRMLTHSSDITGGLPRVVNLFEARRPKDPAVVTEIDGVVQLGKRTKGQRIVYVVDQHTNEKRKYTIPRGRYILFGDGDEIRAGEALADGAISPHDILAIKGHHELQKFLVQEVQQVYRQQGVGINDKHLEVIIRQMLRWMVIEDQVGDTPFVCGDWVDRFEYNRVNQETDSLGGEPAKGRPILVGITKAALSTSFISAASFQETAKILTNAAVRGEIDFLRGLKENVIIGKLIPAGTGFRDHRSVELAYDKTFKSNSGGDVFEDLKQEGKFRQL